MTEGDGAGNEMAEDRAIASTPPKLMSVNVVATENSQSPPMHARFSNDAIDASPGSGSREQSGSSKKTVVNRLMSVARLTMFSAEEDSEAKARDASKMDKPADGGLKAGGMFGGADAMRNELKENLGKKDYDVADFYHETGVFQAIARNARWQTATLVVISINSLWIGIEMDLNKAASLTAAKWYFQVGEYTFCAIFFFEWFCRFMAFKRKCDGLRDKWFCFDAFLVSLMIFETLLLPQMVKIEQTEDGGQEGGGQDMGQLSMLRMLRLLRLTRMVRFMRSVPELVTLLKSMSIAAKPVMSTCSCCCHSCTSSGSSSKVS